MINKELKLGISIDGVSDSIRNLGDLANAANQLAGATDKAEESTTDLNASFEDVYGDIQPLTARMGELEDRLYELAAAGQQGSQEFKDLTQKVGEYKRVQQETDRVVDAAALTISDKLGGALQGAVGAFAGVQGAMAVVGVESEELEETLLKVQGALAIAEGVRSVREAGPAFVAMGTAAKTALSSIRTGIAATGIGLFLVAAGAIVAYWEDIIALFEDGTKELESQLTANEGVRKSNEDNLKLLELQKQESELRGESTKDINAEIRKQIILQKESLRTDILRLETQLEKEKAQSRELTFWEKTKLTVAQIAGIDVAAGVAADILLGKQKAIDDTISKIQQLKIEEAGLNVSLATLDKPQGSTQSTEPTTPKRDIAAERAALEQELATLDEVIATANQRTIDTTVNLNSTLTSLDKDFKQGMLDREQFLADERKRLGEQQIRDERAVLDAKLEIASLTSDSFYQLSGLLKEGTIAAKAAALTDIAIGTGVGFINGLDIAQKGAKATGPAAPFAFPIFYATQVAAVLGAASRAKAILKGNNPSTSTPSPPQISVPSPSSFNPSQALQNEQQINRTATIQQNGSQSSIKAYVVSGEMSSQQEADDKVRNLTRL